MSSDPRFTGPGPDEVFAASLAEGRFIIQRCLRCASTRHPPALVCSCCGSPELEWIEPSGAGVVHATTTVREREGSYNVAIIELAEGARLMSKVGGVAAESVRIGLAVRARIAPEPQPHIVFDAAGEAP